MSDTTQPASTPDLATWLPVRISGTGSASFPADNGHKILTALRNRLAAGWTLGGTA
ncbi:hypothetical protein MTF65_02345 [Streptomyces sp. APSN-46.1]|uniref:hypothetical protein n=1 Tax=Streptomyces sp. APSN-46.1 TaxID=2929049 RepID=UPI001FB4970C|nr:hypothetical protein [Streptomyces sp. APSN-46.1]MCJ1676217.1 hypothetical protein [Streptomyces sp. APSN-46.1]